MRSGRFTRVLSGLWVMGLLSSTGPALAGVGSTGILRGQIVEGSTGAPVADALVLVVCVNDFTFTDNDGLFSLAGDEQFIANCPFEVIHSDYRRLKFRSDITFINDQLTGLDPALDPIALRPLTVTRTPTPSLLPEVSGYRVTGLLPTTGSQWHFDGTGPVIAGDDGSFYVVYGTLDGYAQFNRNGQLVSAVSLADGSPGPVTIDHIDAGPDGLAMVTGDRLRIVGGQGAVVLDASISVTSLSAITLVGDRVVVWADGTLVVRRDAEGGETLLNDYTGARIDGIDARDGVIHVLYELMACAVDCRRIDRLDLETGTVASTIVTGLTDARAFAVDADGGYLIGACRFDPAGVQQFCLGSEIQETYLEDAAQFATDLYGAAFGGDGEIWIKDISRVLRYTRDGEFDSQFRDYSFGSEAFLLPSHVAALGDGLAILDARNTRVQIRNQDGSLRFDVPVVRNYPHNNEFVTVGDLVVGHDGAVYLAAGSSVRRIDPDSGAESLFWTGDSRAIDFDATLQHYRVLGANSLVRIDTAAVAQGGPVALSGPALDLAADPGNGFSVLVRVDCTADPRQRCARIDRYDAADQLLGSIMLEFQAASLLAHPEGGYLVTGMHPERGAVHRLNAAGSTLWSLGGLGIYPGQFGDAGAQHTTLDAQDRLLVTDPVNHRIQILETDPSLGSRRAVIIAGGGPYLSNVLWPATQANAIGAYLTLGYRGFGKSDIQFLSPDPEVDVDQNGLADDIDGPTTADDIEAAITGPFAAQADELVVYLVDHGGDRRFRLSETAMLRDADLAGWIGTWQQSHPGARLIVIYDACESGSFLPSMTDPGQDRYLITSSSAGENAYFLAQGALSFSSLLWNEILVGATLGEAYAFSRARAVELLHQHPLLDADGDAAPNETDDQLLADQVVIGGAPLVDATRPEIGSVTPALMLDGQNAATLTAFDVTDVDPIARVWAVIRPPAFQPASTDNPVQSLLTQELKRIESTADYSGSFERFDREGTYEVIFNAIDVFGTTAVPRVTSVSVANPLRKRAVVVAGWSDNPARRSDYRDLTAAAIAALDQQGHGPDGDLCADRNCDTVFHLSASGEPEADGDSTLSMLSQALTVWPGTDTSDLAVFLAAAKDGSGYRLNDTESIDAASLDGLLDTAEAAIGGRLVVIVDGDGAGNFVTQLTPTAGRVRVLIGSVGGTEETALKAGGRIAFSSFFWKQILNGASVGGAFRVAREALTIAQPVPPVIDDDGNLTPNGLLDGFLSNSIYLGTGVLLAGDDPLIGPIAVDDPLVGDFERLSVGPVTATDDIESVTAVIRQPGGRVVTQPLPGQDGHYADRSYGLCGDAGDYDIALYATDVEGNTSLPALAQTTRVTPCTDFLFFSSFE